LRVPKGHDRIETLTRIRRPVLDTGRAFLAAHRLKRGLDAKRWLNPAHPAGVDPNPNAKR